MVLPCILLYRMDASMLQKYYCNAVYQSMQLMRKIEPQLVGIYIYIGICVKGLPRGWQLNPSPPTGARIYKPCPVFCNMTKNRYERSACIAWPKCSIRYGIYGMGGLRGPVSPSFYLALSHFVRGAERGNQ